MIATLPRISPWIKATVALTATLVVGLIVLAFVQFGSIATALAYVSGQRLLIDSPSKSFGTVDVGTVQTIKFTVMNRTGGPVTIVGARSSCGCTVAADLPMTLPSGASRPVSVVVKTAGQSGDFSARVRLFTDDANRGEIGLGVRGYVKPSAVAEGQSPQPKGES